MTAERALAIDVGTNTVLGAVGERDGAELRIRYDAERIVGLGRGVDRTGRLEPERIAAALDALRAHVAAGRSLGCARIAAVGTSALRDAENREEFLGPAREILGAEIEVISGRREAELTYGGAQVGFAAPVLGPLLVLDIGGGSTELAWGQGDAVADARSLAIGSVRLFERCLKSDPPAPLELDALDRAIEQALASVPSARHRTLLALAGTATSVAMLARGSTASVHGTVLSLAAAERVAAELASSTADARRALPGMIPARADVLVAGARILCAVARWAEASEIVISEGGVRHGLLRELLESPQSGV